MLTLTNNFYYIHNTKTAAGGNRKGDPPPQLTKGLGEHWELPQSGSAEIEFCKI